MFQNKRGISPLIATVMLIGFTIVMAGIVSTFIIRQTKENFNPDKLLEDSSLCDQMFLGIEIPDSTKVKISNGANPSANNPPRLQGIYIKNKGSYAVRGLYVDVKEGDVTVPYIFDKKIGKISHSSLLVSLEGSNEQQYFAPTKLYSFGKDPAEAANAWDANVGIPLPSDGYKNCNAKPCTIKITPIIWDFEREKPVSCLKSVLSFDYKELCDKYLTDSKPCEINDWVTA